jgi:hypothetical protein
MILNTRFGAAVFSPICAAAKENSAICVLTSIASAYLVLSSWNRTCLPGLPLAPRFWDLTSYPPHVDLAIKSSERVNRNQPSHRPDAKPPEQAQWNPTNDPTDAGGEAPLEKIGTAFGEPPGQEIIFSKTTLWYLVKNSGRWLVAESPSRSQDPGAKLGVFATYFRSGAGTEVRSKAAVLLKILLSKGHIGTDGRLGERSLVGPEIEQRQNAQW